MRVVAYCDYLHKQYTRCPQNRQYLFSEICTIFLDRFYRCVIFKDMKAIKIKSYKIIRRGLRSFSLSLPAIWIQDMDLQPGDWIDTYRNEEDELILRAEKTEKT